jgi:hypothetical protein
MADIDGHLDAVQDHVGSAQQVRHRLLLDAENAALQNGASSSTVFTSCLRTCSIEQVRKPPVPQAGSMIFLTEARVEPCVP